MAISLVETDRDEHVLVIRMCREEKRNAINRDLALAMDEALNTLDDDPDLWVGILTGTPLVFSAGSDIAAGGDYTTERGGEYGLIRRVRRTPLIAAVEGPALGGGLELVLACDLVVAAGFVNLVAEPGQAVVAALGLAKRICLSGPVAVRACLAAVNGMLADNDDRGWEATRLATAAIAGSDDTREGVQAFFERRPPVWTGQ